MPSLMRYINITTRCASTFRNERLRDTDLGDTHYSYILCICRNPGISQDQLSRRLYINKSNITRNLAYLESHGYVTRVPSDADRRVTMVYPTEKAAEALPFIRAMVHEWNEYITDGFTPEEMEMFLSMMSRVAERAAGYARLTEEAYGDIDSDANAPATESAPSGAPDASRESPDVKSGGTGSKTNE